jgi:hypothetical protein
MEVVCTHHYHLMYQIYMFSYATEVFACHRDSMKASALANQHMTRVCHIVSLSIFAILLDMPAYNIFRFCSMKKMFYFTFAWPYY